jgi:hypothetical protein
MNRFISVEDRKKIRSSYCEEGLSKRYISQKWRVSMTELNKIIGDGKKGKKASEEYEKQKAEIKELFHVYRWTKGNIAKKFNTSYYEVNKILGLGYKRRFGKRGRKRKVTAVESDGTQIDINGEVIPPVIIGVDPQGRPMDQNYQIISESRWNKSFPDRVMKI